MAMRTGILITILGLVLVFVSPQYSTAEEPPDANELTKEMTNNVSEEYVISAAYYMIACEGVRRSGDLKTAGRIEEARDKALDYALIAAKQGRTEEMAQKVTLARLELNLKSMKGEIDNDISNISILLNKCAARCKEIMQDPDKVMDEWMGKVLKKPNLK